MEITLFSNVNMFSNTARAWSYFFSVIHLFASASSISWKNETVADASLNLGSLVMCVNNCAKPDDRQ